MDLRPFYFGALTNTGRIVAGVDRSRYQASTPCDDWNVHGLLNHLIGSTTSFALSVKGEKPLRQTDYVGDDAAAAFERARVLAEEAWNASNALESTVATEIGDLPAPTALRIALLEAVVHGWDLAKATGQEHGIDPMVAAAMLDGLRKTITPEQRGPGGYFGEEVVVPEDAPIADQLVAFLGRQP